MLAQKLRNRTVAGGPPVVADGHESTSPRILRLRRVAEARGCQGPANDDAAVSTRDNQAETCGLLYVRSLSSTSMVRNEALLYLILFLTRSKL